MVEENDAITGGKNDAVQSQAGRVRVNMLQGQHSVQPMYSNLTSVQSGQGVTFVDFGFIDQQGMITLNRLMQSGEKQGGDVSAKMSCRIALSAEAAAQLANQLNQLFSRKAGISAANQKVENECDKPIQSVSDSVLSDPKTTEVSDTKKVQEKPGFRFPWSKKG